MIGICALLISACTLTQETPTPTPTATPTATQTLTPTASPTPTTIPTETPTPSPTPIISRVPRELALGEGLTYVRAVPNTLFPVTRSVNSDSSWEVTGRSSDSQWLEVRFDDGFTGWIVYLPGEYEVDLTALPISGESVIADRIALVTDDAHPFYNEAGDGIHDDMPHLSALRIDMRTEDGAWLHGVDSEGRLGWASSEGLLLTFDVQALDVGTFAVSVESEPNARVRLDSGGLRLRQSPNVDATVLLNLVAGTELIVSERTTDNAWVLVELREGYRGWVSASYVEMLRGDLAMITENPSPQPVPYFVPPTPEGGVAVSVVYGGARQIYLNGQAMGNRANVFSTVGDSLTDTPYFLREMVYGYNLGDYGYLLPTVNFFNVDTGYGNAFQRRAISTRSGFSTFSVVVEDHPEFAGTCNPGELLLDCEYRLVRPAYSIIMMGTNDAPAHDGATYRANMTRILDISIAHGVVPILSTLPPRVDFNERIIEYNAIILQLAQQYGVPLTDLNSALMSLPNRGLDGDGVHLSIPPGAPASTLIFTAENLQYGTTMRNLTALQALAQVQSEVGY